MEPIMTTSTFTNTVLRTPALSSATLAKRIVALAREWQARRSMRKALGSLTGQQLQDLGLIHHDIEDAFSVSHSHSAEARIRSSASRRAGNW
jgi:uncharacterized protein YjiS (DUF1127 family)